MPKTAPKPRGFRRGLAPLLVIAATAALFVGCRQVQRENVLHPETGFKFPTISQIKRIHLSKFVAVETDGPLEADISGVHWQDVLSALGPSESDSRPLAWKVMGELEIQTMKDQTTFITLFNTGSNDLGAFAAGNKEWRSRKYFRGGNSAHLMDVLINAVSSAPPTRK